VVLRRAVTEDLPALVGLLAADQLGATRDGVWDAADLAVRVAGRLRGQGLGSGIFGSAIFGRAIAEARHHGCSLVQLTTDKSRTDARRSYERLGFVASHEGLKLALQSSGDGAGGMSGGMFCVAPWL
jgi:GNAT superfamily N-acetyltransferase